MAASPLRVAVVIDTIGPWSRGGRETRLAALLPRLDALGIEATVYTAKWWEGSSLRTTIPGSPTRAVAIAPNLPLYRRGRRSILHSVVFALGAASMLVRRFDVLVSDQMPYLHLFVLRAVATLRRRPLVVEWHEHWGPGDWDRYLGGAGRGAALVERRSLPLGDLVVADSAWLATRLEGVRSPARRLTVVSNGVDRRALSAVAPLEGAPAVVAIGRLAPHKRVDLVLEATAALHAGGLPVRLGIVGTGPERAALEAHAAALALDGVAEFVGDVARTEDVWSLLRGARVLLFPSEREGFGLAVAESLALGTPVVCVDAPASESKSMVDEGVTGSVVPAGSAGAIAAAARRWLEDPGDRAARVAAFWARHPELDWDASARRLADLLWDLRGRPA